MAHTLGELGRRFGLEVIGDANARITGVCSLKPGRPEHLSFLANPRYRSALAETQAGAVVLAPAQAQGYPGNALVARDPYLAFARIAALFDVADRFTPGVHPTAVVAPGAVVAASAWVGAHAVVEEGARIGEQVFVGPGCIIGEGVEVGAASRLEGRVWLGRGTRIGRRARIAPGVVIGARGFGLARGPEGWEEVPQLGGVLIGNDVEVGANTTIDRGAIEDTVLEDGVKLDNQIQVAHNVRIGRHTAVAACTGISGSTRIGARCLIGGGVGIAGHLEIADDVVVLGYSLVTKSLTAGTYSSGMPAAAAGEWRKTVARLRRLERMERRLADIAGRLGMAEEAQPGDGRDDD